MKKIRRRCKCGCGNVTNYGKVYIHGHNANRLDKKHSKEARLKMSLTTQNMMSSEMRQRISNTLTGRKLSAEHRRNISLSLVGNIYGKGGKGRKFSKEHIQKRSIARIKYDPNYEYCDIWKDKEYRKDIRKDHCENASCQNHFKYLCAHHIYLDKKRCAPSDIATLCNPCHMVLHMQLQQNKNKAANPKDYIIINRTDRISYIHKKSKEIIRIKKRGFL